jgi:hypothetical protein
MTRARRSWLSDPQATGCAVCGHVWSAERQLFELVNGEWLCLRSECRGKR